MTPIFHAADREARGNFQPERLFLVAGLMLVGLAAVLANSHDLSLLRAIYPGTDATAVPFWRIMSFLGSGYFLATLVVLVSLVLVGRGQGAPALALALGWAVCALTVEWLKWLLARDRPPVAILDYAAGNSLPSGHAAQSFYVYGYLFWVVLAASSQRGNPNRFKLATRWMLLLALLLLPFVVGVSRVYLGVHWPSDVLAGWGIGLVFSGIALVSRP